MAYNQHLFSYTSIKGKVAKNQGLINLFGKSTGRMFFMGLLAYLAYILPIEEFASFAIFWSALRMFTFYGGNNLYIIYFNKVREEVIGDKQWPRVVSSNILLTFLLFTTLIVPISYFVFESVFITISLTFSSFLFLIVRSLAEFSKIDDNVFLSIFLEDFFFNIILFLLCFVGIGYENSFTTIVACTNLALLITVVVGIWLFLRKFKMLANIELVRMGDFSKDDFKVGLNYSILRGNDVLANFAVRYMGQIFYGSVFVAYSHVMYQFYNIFTLLTISVISGFQSKITLPRSEVFNLDFIKKTYYSIVKPLWPFVLLLSSIIIVFRFEILNLVFPKFVAYDELLIWICVVGIVYAVVQPLIYIIIYNNKFTSIKNANRIQYLVLGGLLAAVLFDLNQDVWLLSLISIFTLIQGAFCLYELRTQRL